MFLGAAVVVVGGTKVWTLRTYFNVQKQQQKAEKWNSEKQERKETKEKGK